MAESERVGGGIALNIPVNEDETAVSSPKVLPRRLRSRLLEPKSSVSAEVIQAKLKEADLRRQQYYESLSSKARPKIKSPSRSSAHLDDLGRRLEAKLNAAENKRLSILEKAQTRLAKLDELRQAAKTKLELRFEKERYELGTKVESQAQKAARNRMLLFKAIAQRRAARSQRAAQRLDQKKIQQNKYKECILAAIHQKRAAAEKKRLGILEAEKTKACARLMRVHGVANSVDNQRETERRRMKDRLEDGLQRAKKLRAQYLRERRGLHGYACPTSKAMHEHGEHLSRMLARCWRRFEEYKKTTYCLASSYCALNINEKSVESVPFEQLAIQINSATVIQTTKALLDRLQTRLFLSHITMDFPSIIENINHLLKCIASPVRRGDTTNNASKGGEESGESRERGGRKLVKLVRYPARIFLCAYMIRQHPDAVFRVRGDHEIVLAESAASVIRGFELLMNTVLDVSIHTLQGNTTSEISSQKTFRSQLAEFDEAWCSYLHCFVVWKVEDAKLLEEDLLRSAYEVERSGMEKRKHSPESGHGVLAHHMAVTQKQVMEDHKHPREYGSAVLDPKASPLATKSKHLEPDGSRRLEKSERERSSPSTTVTSKEHDSFDAVLASENELIVNEIVHDNFGSFTDSFYASNEDVNILQAKVKETMEKAFWDGVMESIEQAEPDFSWVLKLMSEVRDELSDISPKDWRQDIVQTIDTDVLSQVLRSGDLDMDYLSNILEYALVTLMKLSAPANEEEIRTAYQELVKELQEITQAGGQPNASYAVLMVKGLRFVLQQIQVLKKEISKARLKMLEPLLKGPAGLEYLKKAFVNRHGPPDQASASLPLTKQWLLSLRSEAESEWNEYTDSVFAVPNRNSESSQSQGLPPSTLRTGGSLSTASKVNSPSSTFSGIELSECRGETADILVRLGLLKLVNQVGGLTLEALPETLRFNLSRLRAIQSQIQKIDLISISVLILQQTLVSENLVSNPADMESMISNRIQQLSELLESVEDAGLPEIIETISQCPDDTQHSSNPEKLQARKHVMANMIVKSLQPGNPIFTRVSRTIYLATRAAVLSGNSLKRKQLVEAALRRVGAARLADKVVAVADVLVLVALVSRDVNGPWYEELLKSHGSK